MTTFSCCMIVKNEEKVLRRCLDSICDLMDEIIIVDTGSTDSTKAIASEYTDKIYDFEWIDDFSAARNFSFSKATMDYIYTPDADEYLDEENHHQLKLLKECIDSEIDIVQMMYNTVSLNTVLNIQREYRPRLFKRLRTFTWIDPIHETVRMNPLVFDSDIVITHAPEDNHAKRDFSIYQKHIKLGHELSRKLIFMYATELIKVGTITDFEDAKDYFQQLFECSDDNDIKVEAACVLFRLARLKNDDEAFKKLLPEYPAVSNTSEICYDLGLHAIAQKNYERAIDWLRMAINEVHYALDVHTSGDLPLESLLFCYDTLIKRGDISQEQLEIYKSEYSVYSQMLQTWAPPVEQPV